ncbi:MAG: GTPase HflX [Bacteroidota bacterium]
MAAKAILVGLATKKQTAEQLNEYLDELAFLAETAGVIPVKRFTQKLEHPDGRTFVGKGKLAEIKTFVEENKIEVAIFDDDLTPSQFRNIEDALGCRLLDRSTLILDIFAVRARSANAKTQVELAQYEYLLPRLTGMWSHLSKQRGGIGMRGPGEKEIETDRRIIRKKIALLKEQLKNIDKQMRTQRKNREQMPRVALVGYTNVGKSTLMNLLSKSTLFAENKLFATLDTTVRKVVVSETHFLLSDTVGFIRKLPHHLIESFRSTLDEIKESDLLVHVVDISHPGFEDQIYVVKQTLMDLGVIDKPTILCFNKVDTYTHNPDDIEEKKLSIADLEKTWMAKENAPCVFISATKQMQIDKLKQLIIKKIKPN